MLTNYPAEWGFITKAEQMKGKTIGDISIEKMPWGCTWSHCILIRFSDGSRGFLLGENGDTVIGPDSSVYEGRFFTPEEYAQVKADEKRKADADIAIQRRSKERLLERLKKELGQ